jgi:hypothetical protein
MEVDRRRRRERKAAAEAHVGAFGEMTRQDERRVAVQHGGHEHLDVQHHDRPEEGKDGDRQQAVEQSARGETQIGHEWGIDEARQVRLRVQRRDRVLNPPVVPQKQKHVLLFRRAGKVGREMRHERERQHERRGEIREEGASMKDPRRWSDAAHEC